jgi:hypothetical protein
MALEGVRQVLEQAVQGAANPADLEKYANALKAVVEAQKLDADVADKPQWTRREQHKFYFSLLAPLFAVILSGGTLFLQIFQTNLSEQGRQEEQRRQRDAAEDLRWSDAMKALSQEQKFVSPATYNLKAFFKSERYGILAEQQAFQVLAKTTNTLLFRDLIVSIFVPVEWTKLNSMLALSRTMSNRYGVLEDRRRADARGVKDAVPLSKEEDEEANALIRNVSTLCEQIAPLFKTPRPRDFQLDISFVAWWDCDLSGANLSHANLAGFYPQRVLFKDADFSDVVDYQKAIWTEGIAWWQASAMSREMAEYLRNAAPYRPPDQKDSKTDYGRADVSESQYQEAIKRLLR